MSNTSQTYQKLTPECQLDALASIGIYPETGLLALNSYENRVFSFTDEQQQRYVVKFYRPERWNEQQLLEDHVFSKKLTEAGLQLSAPLEIDGSTLHNFAGYFFALFENLSARSLAVDDVDSLYEVGIALGKLHKVGAQHQFTQRPSLSIDSTIKTAIEALRNCQFIPTSIHADVFQTLQDLHYKITTKKLPKLTMIAIHGDAHASNILLKEGQPYWVDFDDCKMGPAVQDVWMLLHGDRNEQLLQISMILEGYQEEYEFETEQLAYIEVLRTLRMINYTAWIHNRWEDPAFSRNFPWFITEQYWKEWLQSLQQQLVLLDEAPIMLQPHY
ncbi:serine/threonine protein kinase [Psychromonas sp. 14N.309.X.WAT.B.A12]|uniref:serine/threonine protein kinase n=1 Tax=Psychromonas sp. 14N.309.X.WAT.B.A12 TaxID=2998322 RepID=UPI0025B0BA10|nr:serine/threonine protein kinase [Psychromonas sp. 14N.309.X.WAT.B.A12]MDN2664764.1 serine/threonine protein kinase [Psychromonas sp. 14N.309.X.WAT.B.A12]